MAILGFCAVPPGLSIAWCTWMALAVGGGIGFGISGARRGSRGSRSVAMGCLLLHLVFAFLLPAIVKLR
jgi:hypothetical protein